MSTRSLIAKQNKNGSITSIYCHNDGYPSGVGKILKEHYANNRKVVSLIALGWISSLEKTINGTVAYYRDRSQDKRIDKFKSIEEFDKTDLCHDYVYLWDGKRWKIKDNYSKYANLTKKIIKDDE